MRPARAVLGLTVAALLLGTLPASATVDAPVEFDITTLPEPTAEQIAASISRFTLEGSVQTIDTVETQGEETVITLTSDILFEVDGAEVSPAAAAAVAGLVANVPDGATLSVHGHTDSVGDDAHNLDLSLRRAQAVGAAVAASRPDLVLDVQGFGETQLKTPEEGDDPGPARAENRRVELRFKG